MRRAVLTVLTVLSIALAGAASVRAADPLVGGTLSAGGHEAIVTSHATMPVLVTLTGEAVTADPSSFTLDPGGQAHAALSGPNAGTLSALLQAIPSPGAGDAASVTLTVNLSQARVPPTVPWGTLGIVALIVAALALLLRRVRPWQYRIARREV